MRKQWWCADCRVQIELDIHGRCRICGSDAVDRMKRGGSPLNSITLLTEASTISGHDDRRDRLVASAGLAGLAIKAL